MNVIATLLLTSTLSLIHADECGNRCTSTQICMRDGTCHERSDLVSCPSFTSIYERNYCRRGQECCGTGCMPEGKVCCQISYCEAGRTCCSIISCCPAGTFCSNFRCIDDKYSTMKPTTATPRPTFKPRTTSTISTTKLLTTSGPDTRYPIRTYPTISHSKSSTYSETSYSSDWTTKRFKNTSGKSTARDTESAFKPWHYAIIGIGVMFVIVVCALAIRSHHVRKQTPNAQSQTGRNGIVLNAPPQIYGQGDTNTRNNSTISGAQQQIYGQGDTNTRNNSTISGAQQQIYGQGDTNTRNNSTISGATPQLDRSPQQINVAYVITKPVTQPPVNGQQNSKRMIFVIAKSKTPVKADNK